MRTARDEKKMFSCYSDQIGITHRTECPKAIITDARTMATSLLRRRSDETHRSKSPRVSHEESNVEWIDGQFQRVNDERFFDWLSRELFRFSLFSPMRTSSSSSRSIDSMENLSSQVERSRISHFGREQSSHDADIDRMIRASRPYSQAEFNRTEYSRNEWNNLCEFVPASNMTRHEVLLHGTPLYIDRNVTVTNLMIDQGKQLAWLLSGLAKQVFHISEQTMHLFRDVDSGQFTYSIIQFTHLSLFQHGLLSIVMVHYFSIFVILNKSLPMIYARIDPMLHQPFQLYGRL